MIGNNKILVIGSDHAGYRIKEVIKNYLLLKGYKIRDCGTFSEESVDYPDYAHLVAADINDNNEHTGILVCGSGNGVCITANKHQSIRAALCWTTEIASLARLHNDANILCLPARFIDSETAINIVNTFLNTNFEGGRHERRIKKIPL
ncbi:MAG: ribose 5-phosphate isomerase B [Bacteroidetes bacterium]|nr:ribose 5-phosphate isomerase B [Bacteroidota bacterium]